MFFPLILGQMEVTAQGGTSPGSGSSSSSFFEVPRSSPSFVVFALGLVPPLLCTAQVLDLHQFILCLFYSNNDSPRTFCLWRFLLLFGQVFCSSVSVPSCLVTRPLSYAEGRGQSPPRSHERLLLPESPSGPPMRLRPTGGQNIVKGSRGGG
jgi:hypothetical protein